jgi:hypothetical protein
MVSLGIFKLVFNKTRFSVGSTSHLHNHFIAKLFVLLRVLFFVRPNFGVVAVESLVL